MNALVRAAVADLREHGFIPEDLRSRMTPGEVATALNLVGA